MKRNMVFMWVALFFLPTFAATPKTLPPISQKELSAAYNEVAKLMGPSLKDLSEKKKTTEQVAMASEDLCAKKDISNAVRYLLLKGAFEMYAEAGRLDLARNVIRSMDETYRFDFSDISKILGESKIDFRSKRRYDHREIAISTFWGLNDDVISNTNLFPVVKDKVFYFNLPGPFAGMRAATLYLNHGLQRMELNNVSLERVLPEGSTDADLLKEYKMAVKCVSEILGVNIWCGGLSEPWEWTEFKRWHQFLGVESQITVSLARGYEISIRANDAKYILRRGRYIEISSASVEINIRNLKCRRDNLSSRKSRCKEKVIAIERQICLGSDCSAMLSELVKDATGTSVSTAKERRELERRIRAADAGDVDEMRYLALLYRNGKGVKRDPKMEFKYSKMAADSGDKIGLSYLAVCYNEGRGVRKDVKKAMELFGRSAIKGDSWAMSKYAEFFADGIGTEKNPNEAAKWFLRAAEGGNTWAKKEIARYALTGVGMKKDLALAKRWILELEKDAEDDDPDAAHMLCHLYLDGYQGVDKDKKKIYNICQLAIKGNAWCSYKYMARCYLEGIGTEKDYAKAREYIILAKNKAGSDKAALAELDKWLKKIPSGSNMMPVNPRTTGRSKNGNGTVLVSTNTSVSVSTLPPQRNE